MTQLSTAEKAKVYVSVLTGYIFIAFPFLLLFVLFNSNTFVIKDTHFNTQELLFSSVCLILLFMNLSVSKIMNSVGKKIISLSLIKENTKFEKAHKNWHVKMVLRQVFAECIGMFGFVIVNTNKSFNMVSITLFAISIILLIKGRPSMYEFNKELSTSINKNQMNYRTG